MQNPAQNDPIASIRKALLLSLFSQCLSRVLGKDDAEAETPLAIELKVLKASLTA